MSRTIFGLALFVGLCSTLAFTSRSSVPRRAGVCAGADDHLSDLIDDLQLLVGHTDAAGVARREAMHIPAISPSSVTAVSSDSLCNIAGETLNTTAGLPSSTGREVYLVKLGNTYWAEDLALVSGDWQRAFVLDSTLTTVLDKILK